MKRSCCLGSRGFWYREPKSQNKPTSLEPRVGEELLNDLANDRQVEPVRVGMTLRIGFPAPQNSSLIFSGRRMCALVFRTCLHRDGNVSSFNRLRCENRPERFVAEMKDTCREMSNSVTSRHDSATAMAGCWLDASDCIFGLSVILNHWWCVFATAFDHCPMVKRDRWTKHATKIIVTEHVCLCPLRSSIHLASFTSGHVSHNVLALVSFFKLAALMA